MAAPRLPARGIIGFGLSLILNMKRPGTARRPRNPVARAVRTPLYRPRAEEDKRRKLRDPPVRPRGPVEPDES